MFKKNIALTLKVLDENLRWVCSGVSFQTLANKHLLSVNKG